jgi:nicotinamidase-related amidase
MTVPLATARRALVVIDVQNEYVTGNLRIEHPPVAGSLARISQAMQAAAARGIPVVVVQNTAPAGSPLFARGTDGWELHAAACSVPHDHWVEKRLPDAFAQTDLGAWLTARGIDTISVAGYMTHNCVDATVRTALHRGYRIELLEDATGSVSYANRSGRADARRLHETFLIVMQSRFAAVLPVGEWIEAIDGLREPERDTIYGSSRRAHPAQI